MENKLEVSSSLDLNVNKDDLMEMLIDQQLTKIEEERDLLIKEKNQLLVKNESINKEAEEELNKRMLKLLPKEITLTEIPEVHVYYSTITFLYKNFDVVIKNIKNTELYGKYTNQISDNKLKIKELDTKINDVNANILKIEKSGKRIKAKMLKEFLNNSTEGKSILTLMNKSEIKLIG